MFATTTASLIVDSTGTASEIVVVLTPQGVLRPLVNYFRLHAHTRSISWQRKVAQATVLFLEYMAANPLERDRQLVFQNFALRMATGTFHPVSRIDSSRLGWTSRSPEIVNGTLSLLTNLFRYLKQDRPLSEQLNPEYSAAPYDRLLDQAAYTYRRESAMLGYSWSTTSNRDLGPRTRVSRPPKVTPSTPPAFPESKFEELLLKGFLGGPSRDYRGACITLLMHGAGFRESEPFHLFVQDVFPTPGKPTSSTVLIHHPAFGEAPYDWTAEQGRPPNANREQYLVQCFGLRPRNHLTTKLHSGWKNPLLDSQYFMRAYWFADHYGRWFKELWDGYVRQLLSVSRSHPWAFVNLTREPVGAPYKLSQFNKAHAAACERIGLQAAKPLGTTPHGHRHAYGQRLQLSELDPAYIKRMMHHNSLEAQQTYTSPSPAEVAREIEKGMIRLTGKLSASGSTIPDFHNEGS